MTVEEGFEDTDSIPMICHNCLKPIKLVPKGDYGDEIVYDQCESCNQLPSDPQPPEHHLDTIEDRRVAEIHETCPFCQNIEAGCICKFCPKPGCCTQFNSAAEHCPECFTALVGLREVLEIPALLCRQCGMPYPNSTCEHPQEEIREPTTRITQVEATGPRPLTVPPTLLTGITNFTWTVGLTTDEGQEAREEDPELDNE